MTFYKTIMVMGLKKINVDNLKLNKEATIYEVGIRKPYFA